MPTGELNPVKELLAYLFKPQNGLSGSFPYRLKSRPLKPRIFPLALPRCLLEELCPTSFVSPAVLDFLHRSGTSEKVMTQSEGGVYGLLPVRGPSFATKG